MAVDNMNHIAVFVRVVQRRSFTHAARDLKISPSAVSRHIDRLEQSLGVQLIKRSTRHLVLTDSAKDFYQECARIMRALENAQTMVSARDAEVKGTLRVHATLGFGQRLIAPSVREFLAQYPDIKVDLTIGSRITNLLGEGFDIAIGSARINDSSLSMREFSDVPYAICAAPKYLAKHGTPKSPLDLTRFNCLVHSGQTHGDRWQFNIDGQTQSVIVDGTMLTNNGTALYEAVKSGLGIARLPGYAVSDDLRSGELVGLFQNLVGWGRSIKAYYPRNAHQPLRVRVFLDFIADCIRRKSIVI